MWKSVTANIGSEATRKHDDPHGRPPGNNGGGHSSRPSCLPARRQIRDSDLQSTYRRRSARSNDLRPAFILTGEPVTSAARGAPRSRRKNEYADGVRGNDRRGKGARRQSWHRVIGLGEPREPRGALSALSNTELRPKIF